MSNTYLKILTALTATFVFQSAIAGVHVRYACQRNIGKFDNPYLTKDIIIVQSVEPSSDSLEKFSRDYRTSILKMHYKLTRFIGPSVPILDSNNPYADLDSHKLTREQMSGEPIQTTFPARSISGSFRFIHTRNDGSTIRMGISRASLNYVNYDTFPKGEHFVPSHMEDFVCYEPDFFEASVEGEQIDFADDSAEFTRH